MSEPRKNYQFAIDLESNITRLTVEMYKETDSSKELKGDTIYYKGMPIESIEYQDVLNYEKNIHISSFTFHATDIDDMIRGSLSSALSFAYIIPNTNHSLTHQFKQNGFINQTQFTLKRMSDTRGKLIFGDLNENDTKETFNTSCDVIGEDGNWDCDIDSIIIGNYTTPEKSNVYRNKYSSYFSTMTQYILAPHEFYEYIIERLFQQFIDESQCYLNTKMNDDIRCNCSVISKINYTQVFITINGRGFTLNMSDLFYKNYKECVFVISKNMKDINQWVLGNYFLSKYIVSFNYDDSKVMFYSSQPFLEYKSSSSMPLFDPSIEIDTGYTKMIIISLSILLILFLTCLVYSKLKYLRRERNNILPDVTDYQKIDL